MEPSTWLCEACLVAFNISSTKTDATPAPESTDQQFDGPSPKRLREEPATPTLCQCCLGLLDASYHERLVETITARLHEESYQGLDSFQLCLQLPPQLALLQAASRLTLTNATISAPSASYVKEELKLTLCRLLEQRLKLTAAVNSSFQITLKLTHDFSSSKYFLLLKKSITLSKSQYNSSQITLSIVEQALPNLSFNSLQEEGLDPSALVFNQPPSATVSFSQASLFIAGRYNKYSRTLSQTPWFVDGERKGETSVQELICDPIKSIVLSTNVCFSSSGREDVDVRMLGNGRPFMLEFVNPRVHVTIEQCRGLEEKINSSTELVAVSQLTVVRKKAQGILKEGEEEKRKHYCALVWCSQGVTGQVLDTLSCRPEFSIAQKTPIRVLHRRSAVTRNRMIYSMRGELVDANHFYLHLVTQAGTYIKEFVHGDFGRTVPNMCELLSQDVDILTLDVLEIGLEWPPHYD